MSDTRTEESRQYAAERYGIPVDAVVGYRSGICYSKVWVNTQEAADAVTEKVSNRAVNGGWFDGMALGGQTHLPDGTIEVMV